MTKLRKLRDLAEAADVKVITLRRAIERGELRAYRVGRSVRVSDDDFRKFIKPIMDPQKDSGK